MSDATVSRTSRRSAIASVRFTAGELAQIQRAADAAGVTVSSFIRNAAFKRPQKPVPGWSSNGATMTHKICLLLVGDDETPLWQSRVGRDLASACCDGHATPDDAIDHGLFKLRDRLRDEIANLPAESHGYQVLHGVSA